MTRAPCLDPARSADFLSDNNREGEGLVSSEYVTGDKEGEFYPLELDRFDFLRDERQEILLKCTQDEYDPRYKNMGVSKTEDYIQERSGVTDILEDLPRFSELVDTSFRARKSFSLWTRNTIPWSLECEQGGLNRQKALEKV